MDAMRHTVDAASAGLAEARSKLGEARERVAELSRERDRLQGVRADAVAAEARAQTEHGVLRVRIDEAEARQRRNVAERTMIAKEIDEQDQSVGVARAELAQLVDKQAALAEEEAGLRAERERLGTRFEAARVRARQAREAHERARTRLPGVGSDAGGRRGGSGKTARYTP